MDHLTVLLLWCMDCLFAVSEIIAVYWLLSSFLEKRKSKNSFGVIFAMQVLVCIVNDTFTSILILKEIIFIALLLAGAQILYSGSVPVKFLCVCLSRISFYIIEGLVLFGMQYKVEAPFQGMLQNDETVCAMQLVSNTLLLIFTFLCRKYRADKKNTVVISWRRLISTGMIAILCCTLMIEFTGRIIKSAVRPPIEVIVGTASICMLCLAVLFAIHMVEKEERTAAQIRLLQQKQRMQLQNINDLKDAYAAQRKNAHEFNRHLTIIAEMLQQEKSQMAKDYIASVMEHQTQRVLAVNTHNIMIDTIFNQFYYAAQKQKVDVNFRVNDLSEFCMPADDTVVLLTNLLDNALEACGKLESDRKTYVQMIYDEKQNETFLSIRNTSLPVKIENNTIETTKVPSVEHGYGLKNVGEVLKKYSAESAMDFEDGWFQFTALIPTKSFPQQSLSAAMNR